MIEGLLFIAPFLVLLGLLSTGRYPGERLLLQLVSFRPRPGSRRERMRTPPLGRLMVGPRGSSLLASSLAGRAPPL